jgi:hypothetical protein
MGESFWQKVSLTNQMLFELWLIMIFSPVANFVQQSLHIKNYLVVVRKIIFYNNILIE